MDATSTASADLAARIFAGSGEMAALIRERDWASTPLGPVESWPQSLRTAVSICLGSRHPIVLWWGPERWMFYNDGYRRMLGANKHPQFLGASGQACWAEIWDIIGPMMDQVIATAEATWSENMLLLMQRDGYSEETYFTFSYSPIRDESGRTNGIFNACSETTAHVLSQRRMKALQDMNVDARSVEEAARRCAEVLAGHNRDVSFALVYLFDKSGLRLDLAGHAGLEPGTPASPANVEVQGQDAAGWPLAEVAASGRGLLVDDLARRFDNLPTAPWDEPSHQAMLLPIARAGSDAAAGVLVLGISPRRAFDEAYRGFFELIAGNVATAVSNAYAYEEQRERAEALAALDRAKTTFFNNVSHEFRTPLTLILGPVEDALHDPARALRGESLEAVHRSTLRMVRLVNNLLDFSRIEAGRLQSSFEPTDLSILTAGLVGSFQSLMESASLRLVVACPPLPEPVYVDRSHWEKIVLNLVSNAFKFTLEGEISVRLVAGESAVSLTVSDTGTGIPEQEQAKIFDRFHRVEGARGRSFEGTGIGLALVQELVRQHGGDVRVRSEPGRGSEFCVTIPRGRAHLPADRIVEGNTLASIDPATVAVIERLRMPAPAESGSGVSPQGDRARLLVADDNADMREYLLRLLSPRWEIEAVVDGVDALASALRHPPDLVLSDVMMPRMDGVALLRALRGHPATATIPIVLLSARAGEEAIVAGIETGADDYLIKPFSARELLSRVQNLLELARMRHAAADAARELAETRAALLKDLEHKNRELEAFSYSVSHDLRAPLRTIDGFSRILLEDHAEALPAEARVHLDRIIQGAHRMDELIGDLLKLSRVSRAPLVPADVDLSALAGKVVASLRLGEPQREIAIAIDEGLVAHADYRLLEILLENLIGNAWKFTGKSVDARIAIGMERQNDECVFLVRDNGAGFDMARVDKLFAPFQRLHTDAEFHGTGIGLATVSRIVDRHGGRIWAEAEVGKGATVFFTLGRREWETTS